MRFASLAFTFSLLIWFRAEAYDFNLSSYNGPTTFSSKLFESSNFLPQTPYSPIPNYYSGSVGLGVQLGGPYSFVPPPPWYMPGAYNFGMGLGMRYGIHGPGLLPAGSASAAWFSAKYGQRRQACDLICPSRCEYYHCPRRRRRSSVDRDDDPPDRPVRTETPPAPAPKVETPKGPEVEPGIPKLPELPLPPPPAPVIDEPKRVNEPKQVTSCEDYRNPRTTEARTIEKACTEENCNDKNLHQAPGTRFLRDLIENVPNRSPVGSARMLMATIYQSCSVLAKNNVICPKDEVKGYEGTGPKKEDKRTVKGKSEILNSHPYLRQITNGNENYCKETATEKSCKTFNICERPPLFVFGGKTVMDGVNLEVTGRLNGVEEKDRSGLDCSGFVTGALRAAGLKVTSRPPPKDYSTVNTKTLLSMGEKDGHGGADCLAPIKLGEANFLKSSDIMVWEGHTFMIESASDDPFKLQSVINGLKASGTPQKCETEISANFKTENLDFDLIMSGTLQSAGLGVMRMRAQDYFPSDDPFTEYIRQLAIKSCVAQLDSNKGKSIDAVVSTASGARQFAVIRHSLPNIQPGNKCSFQTVPKIECGKENCGENPQ